ncbi:NAD(+) diphosphatase [Phytoactinopolyspora halotolerans]|uniref:NAD(+) diphosphatase n=1 Tax=Phytoactinopolyspora halotolerans TaxID=1981512 RepID=A0A6L9SHK2_9ACTN|nr:NAD(+) diphosphatase [Phytoactinopolyspora halotolerans]NEE04134.1 NAD(+) diphosphatase [Phytoactinopolyspora halotolerans]
MRPFGVRNFPAAAGAEPAVKLGAVDDAYTLPGPLALSRSTVDRAAHLRGDEEWLSQAWADPSTKVLVVGDGKVAADGAALRFVRPDQAPPGERYLLGVEDRTVYAAVRADGVLDAGASGATVTHADEAVGASASEPAANGLSLREVGSALSDRDAGLAVHAMALANWHATHGHCPRCGAPTVVAEAGHVRRCPADGSEHYPRTDPAVIMLVVDENDRCLLGHQRRWPARRYSTLAGFVEPGETPEHAVAREVGEEVGISISSCRYAGAQPWPFPSSLMLGFYATAPGAEPTPDGEEIEIARWFTRDELAAAIGGGDVLLPPPVSIARRLIEGWYGGPIP